MSQWTKELPKCCGCYWLRNRGVSEIVFVGDVGPDYVMYLSGQVWMRISGGEWSDVPIKGPGMSHLEPSAEVSALREQNAALRKSLAWFIGRANAELATECHRRNESWYERMNVEVDAAEKLLDAASLPEVRCSGEGYLP